MGLARKISLNGGDFMAGVVFAMTAADILGGSIKLYASVKVNFPISVGQFHSAIKKIS